MLQKVINTVFFKNKSPRKRGLLKSNINLEAAYGFAINKVLHTLRKLSAVAFIYKALHLIIKSSDVLAIWCRVNVYDISCTTCWIRQLNSQSRLARWGGVCCACILNISDILIENREIVAIKLFILVLCCSDGDLFGCAFCGIDCVGGCDYIKVVWTAIVFDNNFGEWLKVRVDNNVRNKLFKACLYPRNWTERDFVNNVRVSNKIYAVITISNLRKRLAIVGYPFSMAE